MDNPAVITCPLLMVLVFGGAGALAWYFISSRAHDIDETWSDIAESLDLDYDAEARELSGEYRSTSVRIYTESHDSDPHDAGGVHDTRTVKTFYETSLSERAPRHLTLMQEDWSTSLVDMEDVEIGDDAFDDAFVIQTGGDEEAEQYLDDEARRRALLEFAESSEGMPSLEERTLRIEEMGASKSLDRMRSNIEALVSCAETLRELEGTSAR